MVARWVKVFDLVSLIFASLSPKVCDGCVENDGGHQKGYAAIDPTKRASVVDGAG